MITFIYGMWFGIALTVLCMEFVNLKEKTHD
jgi:hypothetical protein